MRRLREWPYWNQVYGGLLAWLLGLGLYRPRPDPASYEPDLFA